MTCLTGLHFGFNVPFVVRVDENDLTGPRSAPDCSTLETDPQTTPTGDDYELRQCHLWPERV